MEAMASEFGGAIAAKEMFVVHGMAIRQIFQTNADTTLVAGGLSVEVAVDR